MILDNLETILQQKGKFDEFNNDISGLDNDAKNLIKLLFGVATELNENKQEYVLHGGYAVLMHLANSLGTKAISKWRGSYDLDLVTNESAVVTLKQNLNILSDRKSPKIKGKRTLKIKLEESEKKYKVDLRMVEQFSKNSKENYKGEITTVNIYEIPVQVPTLMRSLKDKLSVPRKLERDDSDIINLLGIFYLKKTRPEDIINDLTISQRKRLYNLFKEENREKFIKENILIEIDSKYIATLRKQLKKRK